MIARSRRPLSFLLTLCFTTTLVPARAFADEAAAPLVVDEVRLHDGSLARGVILERNAEGDVTFRLASGETRVYSHASVAYAGAIGGPPALPAPATEMKGAAQSAHAESKKPPTAMVTFDANVKGAEVHVVTGRSTSVAQGPLFMPGPYGYFGWATMTVKGTQYGKLCTAPCSAEVPIDRQHFAVSVPGRNDVVAANESVAVESGTRVRLTFESKKETRDTGTVLLVAGVVAGLGMSIGGIAYAGSRERGDDAAWDAGRGSLARQESTSQTAMLLVGGGLLLGIGLGVAGAVMMHTRDKVSAKAEKAEKADAPVLR